MFACSNQSILKGAQTIWSIPTSVVLLQRKFLGCCLWMHHTADSQLDVYACRCRPSFVELTTSACSPELMISCTLQNQTSLFLKWQFLTKINNSFRATNVSVICRPLYRTISPYHHFLFIQISTVGIILCTSCSHGNSQICNEVISPNHKSSFCDELGCLLSCTWRHELLNPNLFVFVLLFFSLRFITCLAI